MISPTPAGLMSEMLVFEPAAPSSAGSADNVARERIAMATEGQARVSPLSGAGHSRAPSVSHQEPTVSSRAEIPAASIALVRRQQQRMANLSLQCFMESIGEMSSREMWKLDSASVSEWVTHSEVREHHLQATVEKCRVLLHKQRYIARRTGVLTRWKNADT